MKPLIFTAIIVGVCALLLWGITRSEKAEREKKPNDGTFDERQLLARARAAESALSVLVVYLFADFLAAETGHVWAEPGADAMLGLCLALTVFSVEAVHRDAYFAIGENLKNTSIWFSLYGLLFTANAVLYLARGQLIENGLLTRKVMYAGLSVQYIATLAAVAARLLRAKREDAEEDGDAT